jgi:putative chitinase
MAMYKRGSVGEDVFQIQQALRNAGYLAAEPNGKFGPQTEAAVKAFQTQTGLNPNGVFGPDSWAMLFPSDDSTGGATQTGIPYIITVEHLTSIAGLTTPLMPGLVEWINKTCPQYEIDTPQEYAHFLAQACHETDHFKTLKEYASGQSYEYRNDLGNTQPGDGVKFKGRGIFQTTGRANYLQLGIKKMHRDLFINSPQLLEQPEYAVWSACEYWSTRNLNDPANHPDGDILKKKYRGNILDVTPVEFISITINGGYNGMEERKKFHARAKSVLV